jgi:hypothetical protein
MEDNIWLGCLSIIIVIAATYFFGLNYLFEENRKYMEQPAEVICPDFKNSTTKYMPAKCIKYFNESEEK